MESVEDEHHESTERDEYRLSETRIHRRYGDITSIVDFFHKKENHREDTRTREKHRYAHEYERRLDIPLRTHIVQEEKSRQTTRSTYDEEYEEIGFETHGGEKI
jgi:hypothetical protein